MKRTLACVLVLVLAACKKPQPSPEYMEASGSYTTLLAKYGDDAFSTPEMARVDELLTQVPPKSSDAAAAAELQGRIAAERKRVAQEAAEREKAMASAAAEQPPGDFGRPAGDPPAVAAADADAGSGDALVPGMSVEALRAATDGCFKPGGSMKLRKADRTDADAEMYVRVDSTLCRTKFPLFESRFLVFRDGKLVGNFDKSSLSEEAPPAPPSPAPSPVAVDAGSPTPP